MRSLCCEEGWGFGGRRVTGQVSRLHGECPSTEVGRSGASWGSWGGAGLEGAGGLGQRRGRSLSNSAGQLVDAVRAWEEGQGGVSPALRPPPTAHVLDDAAAAHAPLCQWLQPAAGGPPGFWNHQRAGEYLTELPSSPHGPGAGLGCLATPGMGSRDRIPGGCVSQLCPAEPQPSLGAREASLQIQSRRDAEGREAARAHVGEQQLCGDRREGPAPVAGSSSLSVLPGRGDPLLWSLPSPEPLSATQSRSGVYVPVTPSQPQPLVPRGRGLAWMSLTASRSGRGPAPPTMTKARGTGYPAPREFPRWSVETGLLGCTGPSIPAGGSRALPSTAISNR